MEFKELLKKTVRIIYAFIGLVTIACLIWMIIQLNHGTFFIKMKFFGSAGFFILTLGGLILGIKSIANKM